LTLPVFTIGFYGPLFFNQSFGQSVGIAFGAGALGAATSAYMATFGKKNGLRALVNSRYTFGYYGAMLMAFLNVITEGVFAILDDIVGGQALQTISSNHVPLVVGIIIIGVFAFIIATGGYKFIHYYERYVEYSNMISYEPKINKIQIRIFASIDCVHQYVRRCRPEIRSWSITNSPRQCHSDWIVTLLCGNHLWRFIGLDSCDS